MSVVANIYDSDPISLIAKIKENLSIWTLGSWSHFQIINAEPLPGGTPMIAEMVTLSGRLTIAANGTIPVTAIPFLQPRANELLHLRWEPLDDVEGILWEQATQGRFNARAVHARVNRFTRLHDPNLALTTFWVLGLDRNMALEVRNPNPVALPIARFHFFGFRYMLTPLKAEPSVTTYLPAEGF